MAKCKHPNTTSYTITVDGVTKPIKVDVVKCVDCGEILIWHVRD